MKEDFAMANKKAKRAPKALNIALVVLGAAIIGFAAWAVANAVGAEKQPEDILNSGNIVIEPVEAPEIEDKAFMDGLVNVEKVGRYAGIFVEDGSDEIVFDVFAITVVNNSDKMLQYAQVVITCGGEEYTFDMSTIPAGARAQVLEKDKKALPEDLSSAQTVLTTVTEFQEAPSTYPEVFELTPFEYSVNIKNISKSDISGDVYVYYKTKVGDLYMGGITYRAKVSDLASGEEKSAYAGHFYENDSEILFVTYAK